jgi:hypothetical protein
MSDAAALPASERRALARRLLARHPELRAGPGEEALSLPLGAARVVVTIEAPGSAGAQIAGKRAALRYVLDGALAAADGERARVVLRALGRSLAAIEQAGPREVSTAEDLAALSPREEARLGPAALEDPSALTGAIDLLHQATLRGEGPAAIEALPPCLSLETRPEQVRAVVEAMHTPLVAPCDACGAAAVCPASVAPRRPMRGALRPLRHDDLTAAALAAMRSIAGVFGRPVPAAAIAGLVQIQALRRGVHALPPLPFELSLKRTADRLDPVLRLVEYNPRSRDGLPSREERGPARRSALARLVAPGGADAEAFLAEVEPTQSPGLELSVGLEIDLAGEGVRAQLYAHVEPGPREQAQALVERVLAFAGAEGPQIRAVVDLLDGPGSELVLAAYAPRESSSRRVKLYFARDLDAAHDRSGLATADLGALAPYAPRAGLAVLVVGAGKVGWEKWDFPCARHFQQTAALPAAFADGLAAEDAGRVARILDGEAFAPWYTWLSVGRAAQTVYFVPR